MHLTIAYSRIKKRNLMLINVTHHREALTEWPIQLPLTLGSRPIKVTCNWQFRVYMILDNYYKCTQSQQMNVQWLPENFEKMLFVRQKKKKKGEFVSHTYIWQNSYAKHIFLFPPFLNKECKILHSLFIVFLAHIFIFFWLPKIELSGKSESTYLCARICETTLFFSLPKYWQIQNQNHLLHYFLNK